MCSIRETRSMNLSIRISTRSFRGSAHSPSAPVVEEARKGSAFFRNSWMILIDHLSNRTTAHERSQYHLGKSLSLKEDAVPYGSKTLPEKDQFQDTKRAVPPEEHKILVVWSKDDNQLTKWKGHNIAHVRLGNRPGGLTVDLEVAEVRHLLVRRGDRVMMDLMKLASRDFTIHTGEELGKSFGIRHRTSKESMRSSRWRRIRNSRGEMERGWHSEFNQDEGSRVGFQRSKRSPLGRHGGSQLAEPAERVILNSTLP